ncbi:NACHT domain-containing protein, partial [Dolichospermum circinale CS-545/17]|nr:NACHT domain-containing protein [Dolichospermum circinale CS-545/17]
PQARQLIITQAQKNETVIKILQKLKLNPTQIPDEVDTVYAYTLVEYGVYKHEAILKLLQQKTVKDDFWRAYSNNSPFEFVTSIRNFLSENIDFNKSIIQANTNILLELELEQFGQIFVSVAKRTKSDKYSPYPDWDLDVYPKEFKATISEKTRLFSGREFVFERVREFLSKKDRGYFTIVGDPGMGKSAIAAKLIKDYCFPCYFNIFAEGRRTPEQFLASIRKQLINRYSLQNADNDNLSALIQKVSEKLTQNNDQLIIVIDALDEVEQEGRDNLLSLPQNLPKGVYFLLTRRPYNLQTKRLSLSPDTPTDELDLRDDQYTHLSNDDVRKYIPLFIAEDKEYGENLKQWIQSRNIDQVHFVDTVAAKSENNFMYLRYILPGIAKGEYRNLQLEGLPQGLENYYQDHWSNMRMEEEANQIKVKILYVLVDIGIVSPKLIAEILDQEEYEVRAVLNDWVEYLTKQESLEDGKKYYQYSIYHRSFLEFLKDKDELHPGRKILKEVKKSIADYLLREMA